jgi:hypothetical protein
MASRWDGRKTSTEEWKTGLSRLGMGDGGIVRRSANSCLSCWFSSDYQVGVHWMDGMHRLTCICDNPCSLRSLGDDFGNWLRRIGCRQQKQAWHEEQRLGVPILFPPTLYQDRYSIN